MKRALLVLLVVAAVLLALPALALAEEVTVASVPNGQAGTTLSAEKVADGFFRVDSYFDWTFEKSVDPDYFELGFGSFGVANYTLTANRNLDHEVESFGVRGTITVTNGGDRPTEDLFIEDIVQYKDGSGQFIDYVTYWVNVSEKPVLQPGETYTYEYEFPFDPIWGVEYRNTAFVTISNHSGYLGQPFGPAFNGGGVKDGFSIPESPSEVVLHDGTATITDALTVPAGFSGVYSDAGPWQLTDSGVINYTVTFSNLNAMCDSWYEAPNTATLTEDDSGDTRQDSALVTIYTPPCASVSPLTIGYWKTHAGFNGNNADRVTQYLPMWLGTAGGTKSVQVTGAAQAVTLLNKSSDASNGINKLYAQMLATKLNIAKGATAPAAVQTAISQADIFLAGKDASDWSSLSKANRKLVSDWAELFDHYNNGEL